MRTTCTIRFLLVAALTLAAHPAIAGQDETTVPLSSLKTPASPAFALLGIEPSAVERPATPADFAFNLINHVKDLSVPKDFAVEVSPYWLNGHPTLTWQQDRARSPLQSMARTATVSMASASDAAAGSTSLGVGIRASIWSGGLSSETVAALEKQTKLLAMDAERLLTRLNADPRMRALNEQLEKGQITTEQHQYQQLLIGQDIQVRIDAEAAKAKTAIPSLAISREGFSLDVASAMTWEFTGRQWETHQFRKWGLWATPSWQAGRFTALGVARFVRDRQLPVEENALEAGARAIYASEKATLSLEYVKRAFLDSDVAGKFRLVGIAEHRLGSGTWVTASFGRDRHRAGNGGSLVAQLGLSLNFSEKRYEQD